MAFVKSRCEKSWAEVQADSFIFECRGYAKMKELEVEMEQLRQLVVAMMGREEVGCASYSGGGRGTVGDKVGEYAEVDARVSSPQSGRRLRGGRMTSHKETRRKETGRKEKGWNETGVTKTGGKITGANKENGWKEAGGRAVEVRENGGKETGGKEMGARETGGKALGAREVTCWWVRGRWTTG